MKSYTKRLIKNENVWLHVGWCKQIALSIKITPWSFDIDILCFFIAFEF
jgi:hypothetical protein